MPRQRPPVGGPQHKDRNNEASPFQLPPEVTVSRQSLPDGWSYLFRHKVFGELGRILVQDLSPGHCHISCEVVGDPDDPMTALRAGIFGPLGIAISDRISAANGPASGAARSMSPPASPPAPQEVIESKLMQCERCDAGVALLIFAPDATDPGRFEDYARKMHAEVTRLNLPTWIIGPALGGGPLMDRPADILKVWPERGALQRLRPAEFNPQVDQLATSHCVLNRSRPLRSGKR